MFLCFGILEKYIILPFGALVIIKATAIALDQYEEIIFYTKQHRSVKIDEFHDVKIAGLVKDLLLTEGIHCFLKGYHHRGLYYLLGLYIEIPLFVPDTEAEKATRIIADFNKV